MKNNISLTEEYIKIFHNYIYDHRQGMSNYIRYEIIDHIQWIHTNPKNNVNFYTFRLHYKDIDSMETETGYIDVFGQIHLDKLKLFENFTNSSCLQDFIIDYFYF